MKIIIYFIFTFSLFANGTDILYSTGIELINVFPFRAKNNFYSVLSGNNNVIQKKQYSQFKSPGIENYLFEMTLPNTFDSLFTDLQTLIISEKLYKVYFNPIENMPFNINGTQAGSSSSSIISIANGGTSTSTVINQVGSTINSSKVDGTQTIIVDNNASGRLNGNTIMNPGSTSSTSATTPTSTSSNTSVSKPTNSPSTSPISISSTKGSSQILSLTITILIIALIF